MRLKKLDIYGFKSFAERTEMVFDSGITGVVGPNGSGKSNIADAVRWVLGEQSARMLRGAKMEDVIFGGTEKRKPLSYCEVSLTLDNSDGALPVQFAEVLVTRRVYRNGDSEYFLNKSACRLKDIIDLFRDTGIGKEGYSLIGQGRIDEILSQRGEERRAVFEEAAQAGDEVLGVFISTGLSGAYEGAVRAARAVAARNIGFSYALVDSSSCGYDEAWPVFDAVAARAAGEDLEGCTRAVLKGIESTRFLFTPETLTFLQKGGRIGNAAALLGNLIQLSPVLTVRDGQATTLAKVRTRKKALDKIVQTFKADVEAYGLKRVMVHYIGDKNPAVAWAREVIEPLVGHAVDVLPVSPVIGLHVGPAVGIAYECARLLTGKITGSVTARAVAL